METNSAEMVTCDICRKSSRDSGDDTLVFGEWMRRMNLTVHYFCLLLSTNLQQRGNDSSGIMGFLVRDIRKEVADAQKRICCYCETPGATIQCNNCGKYFDLVCTVVNCCTLQFAGQFQSYCGDCPPMDEYRQQLVDHPPTGATCDICMEPIVLFGLHTVVFPECCRLGFVHKMCMRRYAVSSGYYLSCIWCRSSKFRDSIRLQGIFVPDRDAEWERQKDAYRELHRRSIRCDEKDCLCKHGRAYNKNIWFIYACKVCGSTGAHARCLARSMQLAKVPEPIEFKCIDCQKLEKNLEERNLGRSSALSLETNKEDRVDNALFVTKEGPQLPGSRFSESQGPVFSEDETDYSIDASAVTVIPNDNRQSIASSQDSMSPMVSPPQAEAIELEDSQPHPPSVKLLELRESFNCPGEPFFYLVVYEFDEHGMCKGSCLLRFDDQDPRIKDRSEEALRRVQIRPEDVWFRNKDCGLYAIVHKYMDMF
ncbi:hypothetical protein KR200_004460 [Drosophila serrata]|nr:hypothetical protein KR200_004460 [Drosophila serrata]